jgi:hypothetical protein
MKNSIIPNKTVRSFILLVVELQSPIWYYVFSYKISRVTPNSGGNLWVCSQKFWQDKPQFFSKVDKEQ